MMEMIALDRAPWIDAAFTGVAGVVPGRLLRWRVARRALRVSLFKKLFFANAAGLVLLGGGAALLAARWVRIGSIPPVAAIQILLVAALALCALANAVLIRLALSPLAALEETARRFQQGEAGARVPESPLADEDLGRVMDLFNQVLEWAEADRTRRTELSLRVLHAEERERERFGRALYAGTAQTLAGVLVRMRLATGSRGGVDAGALDEVRREVAAALEEVRSLARRLHPPELEELGVAAALEAHARHVTEGRPIRATFEGAIPEDRLSDGAHLVLFRVVQEALSNAVLHSGGSSVRTRFRSTGRGFLAEIVDDGRGFEPDRVLLSGEGGLGLLGMRERAGYVAGALSVDSDAGGTAVRLLIPWKASRREDTETAPDGA
jgi:two-component system sensor histidine kinase UhpB